MRRARAAGRAAESGCGRCGAQDLETTRLGWVEGLGAWFRSGGPWRPSTSVCRRCGQASTAGSVAYLVRPPGWWSVPSRLARVVRRRRTRVPVPATYLMAAVAGTVLGILAQLLVGWPWWLVATIVVAAVWLLFLSSAFWGRGAGRPLATELLIELDPARGMRRGREAIAERFRAAPFPLYGLPASWAGARYLGGSGSRQARGQRPVVTALSLAHGDPAAEHGPQLRVEVRADPDDPGAGPELRRTLAEELRWTVTIPRPGGVRPPGPAGGSSRGEPDPSAPGPSELDPPWSSVLIRVDGRPVGFDLLAEGRHWVAMAELEGHPGAAGPRPGRGGGRAGPGHRRPTVRGGHAGSWPTRPLEHRSRIRLRGVCVVAGGGGAQAPALHRWPCAACGAGHMTSSRTGWACSAPCRGGRRSRGPRS